MQYMITYFVTCLSLFLHCYSVLDISLTVTADVDPSSLIDEGKKFL
jgi:hypothetical protein